MPSEQERVEHVPLDLLPTETVEEIPEEEPFWCHGWFVVIIAALATPISIAPLQARGKCQTWNSLINAVSVWAAELCDRALHGRMGTRL